MQNENTKDPELKGAYVMRCKCGNRPYLDRIAIQPPPFWIACNCGKVAESALSKKDAIDNWNNGKFYYE